MGHTLIFNVSMAVASIVWLLFAAKIIFCFKTCVREYNESAVTGCIYCAFTVLMMIITPWYAQWFPTGAQAAHYTAAVLHKLMVLLFTWRYVVQGINWDTFVPTWFVPYVGVLISNVVGAQLFIPLWPTVILIYGVGIYWIILVFMVARLCKRRIPEFARHSRAVMVAPASLCVIAYINVVSSPNMHLLWLFYTVMLVNLAYVVGCMPLFFSVPFSPGFAALTFPMAASTLASFRMADVLFDEGYMAVHSVVFQLAGIQMYITTAIIAFVLGGFGRMAFRSLLN